jgi:hypothetical protein
MTHNSRSVLSIFCILPVAAFVLAGCVSTQPAGEQYRRALGEAILNKEVPFPAPPGTRVDSVRIDDSTRRVEVTLSKEFAYEPFRQNSVGRIYDGVRDFFGDRFRKYTFSVRTLRTPVEELIPNFYRHDSSRYDKSRIPLIRDDRPAAVVTNLNRPAVPLRGLSGRNIVLWHSHGWYFNNRENRWEWQRPRLFQSVEDLGPLSFTLPYLIPMLENAGACVYLPRERDTQTHEVLVDNDAPGRSYAEHTTAPGFLWTTLSPGFAPAGTYPANVNPFLAGTARWTLTDRLPSAEIRWVPDIPEGGEYAVYISYAATDGNTADARYTLHHKGGTTAFRINQQIGGGTWHHLGHFTFRAGVSPDSGALVLTNESAQPGARLTADAVRFGGGRGVVERNGSTSGRPRFMEGARYNLQFAGMPDTLVYNLNNNLDDYKDDYQSRAEYGNYLVGAPYGPNKNRMAKGLGIPIDLSLAFHTDAGITKNDTTIGTLSIYSVEGADSSLRFPDGVSRLANRDLADIMQTQIVDDIRALFDPQWRRRELRNADYSESVRPNVPAVLLELLSHQNFFDMKFMLDPQFRFAVARAIYKSMLRFLSVPANPGYVVQPLPISHFAAELTLNGDVALRWRPEQDPLEPTAAPDRYTVYTRVGDGGFDNGRLVTEPEAILANITPGTIYSFKVTAVNDGGESFPSEILAVCRAILGKPTVMIVNGFDRVAGPATIETPGFAGFVNLKDAGVPDRVDYNFTGLQHDFDPGSPFRTNDGPGHGASFADDETRLVAGNSFDYPYVHGMSLKSLGYGFVSCSDEAVMDSMVDLRKYPFLDLILGEEKTTPRVRPALDSLYGKRFTAFPVRLREQLVSYTQGGGALLVSGSYVGSDLHATLPSDSSGLRFARHILKCNWITDHASRTGNVLPAASGFLPAGTSMTFCTELNSRMYAVESPDALAPVKEGTTLLRYAENNFGAATVYRGTYGVVVMGFPFESVIGQEPRDMLMKGLLGALGMNKQAEVSE